MSGYHQLGRGGGRGMGRDTDILQAVEKMSQMGDSKSKLALTILNSVMQEDTGLEESRWMQAGQRQQSQDRSSQLYDRSIQQFDRPARSFNRPLQSFDRSVQQYDRPQPYNRPIQSFDRPMGNARDYFGTMENSSSMSSSLLGEYVPPPNFGPVRNTSILKRLSMPGKVSVVQGRSQGQQQKFKRQKPGTMPQRKKNRRPKKKTDEVEDTQEMIDSTPLKALECSTCNVREFKSYEEFKEHQKGEQHLFLIKLVVQKREFLFDMLKKFEWLAAQQQSQNEKFLKIQIQRKLRDSSVLADSKAALSVKLSRAQAGNINRCFACSGKSCSSHENREKHFLTLDHIKHRYKYKREEAEFATQTLKMTPFDGLEAASGKRKKMHWSLARHAAPFIMPDFKPRLQKDVDESEPHPLSRKKHHNHNYDPAVVNGMQHMERVPVYFCYVCTKDRQHYSAKDALAHFSTKDHHERYLAFLKSDKSKPEKQNGEESNKEEADEVQDEVEKGEGEDDWGDMVAVNDLLEEVGDVCEDDMEETADSAEDEDDEVDDNNSSCEEEDGTETPAEANVSSAKATPAKAKATPAKAKATPAKVSIPTPSEDVDDGPAEDVDDAPSEDVDDAASEDVDDAPSEDVDDAASEDMDDAPAEDMDDAPAEDMDDAPAEDMDDAPAEDMDDTPAEEETTAPAEEQEVETADGGEASSARPQRTRRIRLNK